jgi:hypothetical protein
MTRSRGATPQQDAADAEWVKTHVVWPDDATVRFRQYSGLIGGLSDDLTKELGVHAGIQEFMEDELSEEQANIIVKNHGRAKAIKVLCDEYEGDFVFSEPSRGTLSSLRRDQLNVSVTAGHLRTLCLLGDFDRLVDEFPLAIYPLTVRLVNLVGQEEATERKKF